MGTRGAASTLFHAWTRLEIKGTRGMHCVKEGSATDAWMTGGGSSSLSGSQYLSKSQRLATLTLRPFLASALPDPGCTILHRTYLLQEPTELQGFRLQNGDQVTLIGPSESDHLGPLV